MLTIKIDIELATTSDVENKLNDIIESVGLGYVKGEGWELLGESECEDCGGTGEITVNEPVYPDAGSPTAPIGTRKCHCRLRSNEGDSASED